MCFAIVEVRYRALTESNEMIKLADQEALDKRLETLRANDQVERLRIFYPKTTLTRTTSWTES